jgi:hypothetical protein
VNNAGILRDKSFLKLEPQDLEAILDVHLKGAFFVTQPAFASMKENGYGRIVIASSGAGIFGNFGQSNYGAAKMGLVGLMNVLAVEGAKNNIKVNTIAPIAKTRLTEQLLGPLAAALDPEFVTPLVTYLCSEKCELTHEIFDVGGGRYARIFVGMAKGWSRRRAEAHGRDDPRPHRRDPRSRGLHGAGQHRRRDARRSPKPSRRSSSKLRAASRRRAKSISKEPCHGDRSQQGARRAPPDGQASYTGTA